MKYLPPHNNRADAPRLTANTVNKQINEIKALKASLAAGVWTQIDSWTYSTDVSSVDFTGLDLTSYRKIRLDIDGLAGATDDVLLYLRLDVGSGFETTGYRYITRAFASSSGTADSASQTGSAIVLAGSVGDAAYTIGNAAGESFSGSFFLSNATNGLYKIVDGQGSTVGPTGSLLTFIQSGLLEETAAVEGIRFYMSAGNVGKGRISLYGLK